MTLEDRVGNLERNVDAVVGALEQVTQALRGISNTQNEHSRMLAEHSEALRSIMATQNDHSRTLAEHSEALQAVIGALNEHTRILLEHSVDLQFIKDIIGGSTSQGSAP